MVHGVVKHGDKLATGRMNVGMLHEHERMREPDDESDAHPPLEPVEDAHYVVCEGCGDALHACDCGQVVVNHAGNDGEMCRDCRDEALSAY